MLHDEKVSAIDGTNHSTKSCEVEQELIRLVGFGDFNYAYSISLRNRYLYVENAKAACTTIKASLGAAELSKASYTGEFIANYTANVHRDTLGSPFIKPFQLDADLKSAVLSGDNFFRFTFVKNPFTRALSAFLDKVQRHLPESAAIYDAAGKSLDECLSFSEFVRALQTLIQAKQPIDKHFRPQSWNCAGGKLDLSFVGRVETFDRDFFHVCSKVGLEGAELLINTSHKTGSEQRIAEFYDEAEISRIREIFATDFELFEYDASGPPAL